MTAVRISNEEKHAFCDTLKQYITPPAELRLFGSRVDDTAKGGDIDLLLIVQNEKAQSIILFNKSDILADIKTLIGEQKVDLIVTTRDAIDESAFLTKIYPDSQLLKSFS